MYKSTSVAFWSNFILSLFIWIIIAIFSSQLAYLVGNEGCGLVITISCICIPLAAFSSIQMALFKRNLDFRTLFLVRIIGILIPLIVTIPLAFITKSYWSLIIGMIALNLCNAIVLTWKSTWKPRWFYSVNLFHEMFSFSMWSMVESITIWLTSYLDIFIVGTILSTHYMGIYRTSMTTVGQIMGIITAATTPVLFSALSRLQDDDDEFKRMFFKFQKIVGIIVLPLGIGIFLFRDLITSIILGEQWHEASYMIGWWGLTSAITIVLAHYCSEVYRAKGKPKYSVAAQVIHIGFLVPIVMISINYGFEALSLWRSLARLTLIAINLFLLYRLVKISPLDMIRNVSHIVIASLIMLTAYCLLPIAEGFVMQCLYAILCAFVYLVTIFSFKLEREVLYIIKSLIIK